MDPNKNRFYAIEHLLRVVLLAVCVLACLMTTVGVVTMIQLRVITQAVQKEIEEVHAAMHDLERDIFTDRWSGANMQQWTADLSRLRKPSSGSISCMTRAVRW